MNETAEPTKRDFLYLVTAMAGAVGVGAASWPFIDQMRPDASTLAMASIEVDISSLVEGMSLTVKWRGRPVFIRNRTQQEVEAARATALDDLKDPLARNANLGDEQPATDLARSAGEGKENWIVMVGVCTHLGCVPLGQAGDFAGYSALATDRTMTLPGASGRGPHRRTLRFPRSGSPRKPSFASDKPRTISRCTCAAPVNRRYRARLSGSSPAWVRNFLGSVRLVV